MPRKYCAGRRAFLRGTAAIGLGLAATSTASGASTVPVSPGDSIQQAVLDANSGDTILVEPGTYDESVTLPSGKALTLVGDSGDDSPGAGSDAPVLDRNRKSNESAFWLPEDTADAVTISGFRIQHYGTVPDDTWGQGITTSYRSNVTVEDCSFYDVAGPGIAIWGDGQKNPRNWQIRRNHFSAIAHSAVHLSANEGAEVVDNVVESGDIPVGDSPDRWWEDGTDDHNPKAGIEVHATGRNGYSSTLSDILIRGNRITGTYDDSGIRVLSINKNDDATTRTHATDVTIQNNVIEFTDELGDEHRNGFSADESGITIDANPEAGTPAAVEGVRVIDNRVHRAGRAVNVAAAGIATMRGLVVRGNSLEQSLIGVLVGGGRDGALSDVDLRGNQVAANRQGIALVANASASVFDGVRIRENNIVRNDLVGVHVVGPGDPSGAVVHSNDIVDNSEVGVRNEADGTLLASCNFWGHATGPQTDDNAKGKGNAVVGDIDYTPWLPQSYTRVPEQACQVGKNV